MFTHVKSITFFEFVGAKKRQLGDPEYIEVK